MHTLSSLLMAMAIASCMSMGMAQDRQYDVGDIRVDFLGNSGQFRFCLNNDCSGPNAIRIRIDRIQEIDADGDNTNNRVPSIASQDFEWSLPQLVSVGGANATQVELTSLVSVGNNSPQSPQANLTMTTLFFSTNASIPFGSEVLDVSPNSLKFTATITDWPFLNINNSLVFGLDVMHQGSGGTFTDMSGPNATDASNIAFGNIQFASPLVALVDGVETSITATVTQNGNTANLDYTFPYFGTSLVYDPTLNQAGELQNGTAIPTDAPEETTTVAPTTTTTAAPTNDNGNDAFGVAPKSFWNVILPVFVIGAVLVV